MIVKSFMGRFIERLVYVLFGDTLPKTVKATRPPKRRIISHGIGLPQSAAGKVGVTYDPRAKEQSGEYWPPVVSQGKELPFNEPASLDHLKKISKELGMKDGTERHDSHGIDAAMGGRIRKDIIRRST